MAPAILLGDIFPDFEAETTEVRWTGRTVLCPAVLDTRVPALYALDPIGACCLVLYCLSRGEVVRCSLDFLNRGYPPRYCSKRSNPDDNLTQEQTAMSFRHDFVS